MLGKNYERGKRGLWGIEQEKDAKVGQRHGGKETSRKRRIVNTQTSARVFVEGELSETTQKLEWCTERVCSGPVDPEKCQPSTGGQPACSGDARGVHLGACTSSHYQETAFTNCLQSSCQAQTSYQLPTIIKAPNDLRYPVADTVLDCSLVAQHQCHFIATKPGWDFSLFICGIKGLILSQER